MKFYMLFLLTLLSFMAVGQQKKIDSLKKILKNQIAEDSLRLNTLNDLSYNYYSIDPIAGIDLAKEAIVLGKKLGNSSGLATAYANKGHNHSAKGQDSLALSMYDAALKIRKANNDKKAAARLIYNKGLVFFNQSDYKRANDYNRQAYKVFKTEKDSALMAKMLNSIGINQMYLSQYPEALESYLEAKRIYENLKFSNDMQYASIHGSIGLLYARLEKLDTALDYQNKALKLFEKLDFQEGIANSLTNLGRVYTAMGSPEKALPYYEKSFSIMEKNGNERGTASALTNMGIAHTQLKAYEKAIPYFERTKGIYEKLKNGNNLAIVHQNLGECYFNLASEGETNLNRAEKNYRTSLRYAKEAGSLNLQFDALENIALIHVKKGNYKQAYESKTDALVLRDSFNSVEKKEEIARLETKHEYDKEKASLQAVHDKKQAISHAEVNRQRLINTILTIGGDCLFGSLCYQFFTL